MSWISLFLVIVAILCAVEALLCLRRPQKGSGDRLRELADEIEGRGSARASIVRERRWSLPGVPLVRWGEKLLYRAGLLIPFWRFTAQTLALGFVAGVVVRALFFDHALALVLAFAAFVAPWLFVAALKRRRMAMFELQFPEALDLICRALRAGHTFASGLRMAGDELDDPLAAEFTRVADEIALGLDTRDALAHLCDRIDLPDLGFFSTAVLIQRETGGNLAEIMERLGYVIRERHKFYGKVKAMTAQNRGAALVLLFTPPAFIGMMYAVRKEFVAPLWETASGNLLGIVVLAVSFIGYVIARRLAVVRA